jgi:TPP-dependent pyruvate/acetoin dehydrogenase alpha subunit
MTRTARWGLGTRLDAETLRRMLRMMALTRAFDDRMYRGQRQGKTSFYMKCTGEEAPRSRRRWRWRR